MAEQIKRVRTTYGESGQVWLHIALSEPDEQGNAHWLAQALEPQEAVDLADELLHSADDAVHASRASRRG